MSSIVLSFILFLSVGTISISIRKCKGLVTVFIGELRGVAMVTWHCSDQIRTVWVVLKIKRWEYIQCMAFYWSVWLHTTSTTDTTVSIVNRWNVAQCGSVCVFPLAPYRWCVGSTVTLRSLWLWPVWPATWPRPTSRTSSDIPVPRTPRSYWPTTQWPNTSTSRSGEKEVERGGQWEIEREGGRQGKRGVEECMFRQENKYKRGKRTMKPWFMIYV